VASTVATLTAVTSVAASAAPTPAIALVVRGHGFGHGMGLSQWGAEERARDGQSTGRILAFYYPGARPETTVSQPVRVLLVRGDDVRIGSRSPFTITDARGHSLRLTAGAFPERALASRQPALPLVASAGGTPLVVNGVAYHGTLTLEHLGDLLAVVNTVDLETYVGDVVSAECPGFFAPAALRAQAVASRTYALANLRPGAPFDLYPDNRSQNYGGLGREYASGRAAATATRGEILVHRGRPIDAMFSASNGGFTSSTGPGVTTPLAYLENRRDPFDARSPDADWGPVQIGAAALHRAFPTIPERLIDVRAVRDATRRVVTVVFVGPNGSTTKIGGQRFQFRLGLRSTYFSVQT
jgi:stage II sporulation protein D